MPLLPGIDMSSSSTSNSSARTCCEHLVAVARLADDVESPAASSSCFSPSRMIVWSSAMTTRIMAAPRRGANGQPHLDASCPGRARS